MILLEIENTPAAWSLRALTHEDPWSACGWSEEGMFVRHEAVVAALDPKPEETLLDWGCGTGELVGLLPRSVLYTGFDSAHGMVRRARATRPFANFVTREPTGIFDLVACIGPFNLPGDWSKQRTWHTIRHLWDTKQPRALAVALYAGEDRNCLIYKKPEILRCARDLGVKHDVCRLRNDYLLVVRR